MLHRDSGLVTLQILFFSQVLQMSPHGWHGGCRANHNVCPKRRNLWAECVFGGTSRKMSTTDANCYKETSALHAVPLVCQSVSNNKQTKENLKDRRKMKLLKSPAVQLVIMQLQMLMADYLIKHTFWKQISVLDLYWRW